MNEDSLGWMRAGSLSFSFGSLPNISLRREPLRRSPPAASTSQFFFFRFPLFFFLETARRSFLGDWNMCIHSLFIFFIFIYLFPSVLSPLPVLSDLHRVPLEFGQCPTIGTARYFTRTDAFDCWPYAKICESRLSESRKMTQQ